MSRSKSKSSIDICADCGSPDPSWASINRGILLCVQCCSVHRSMGRHISHVKSLRQGSWPPLLLAMIHSLTAQNVNSIWEHSLDLAPPKNVRKKPQPKDSLHPAKFEFIHAKHRRLAYVFRPRRDDVPCSSNELSRQLHSSVRSANLDTSLRLLVQGADPNYFNQEKGTSCLHVACRTGHSAQAELLVAWGADPNMKDSSGNTPSTAARQGGHTELADRIIELVYEVTDRLAYYLCNKKPDHKSGKHYISLEKSDGHEMTEVAKAARGKLQLLPNHLFEELVMDIYDEIDRRECEAVWNTSAIGSERDGVAFLPVNPILSAPRNQGRQKLARLSPKEMAALLRDVLIDATRRQHIATLNPQSITSLRSNRDSSKRNNSKQFSQLSDDEPLYDSVASDDDYAALVPILPNDSKVSHNSPKCGETVSKTYDASFPVEKSSVAAHTQSPNMSETQLESSANKLKMREIEILQEKINSKDDVILELQSELKSLQKTIENLTNENVALRSFVEKGNSVPLGSSPPTRDVTMPLNPVVLNNAPVPIKQVDSNEFRNLISNNQRPTSMYETREGPKTNWRITKHQLTTIGGLDTSSTPNSGITLSVPEECMSSLIPTAKDVNKHTEVITKGIQELWAAMQDPVVFGHLFVIKADRIQQSVIKLISIFPDKYPDDDVCAVLSQLSAACENVSKVCLQWGSINEPTEVDGFMLNIRTAAYELAKATKLLVTNFQLDEESS